MPVTLPRIPWLVAGVLLLVLTNIFAFLPTPRIHDWDEARHGITAYEMIKRGDYVTNTYLGEPDYWNTKPPLSFYPIIAGYRLFGFNTLGLRFFSAAFVTVLFCMVYTSTAREQGAISGMLATLILATGKDFIFQHNARTGDPDALFLLLYVASVMVVFPKTRKPYRFYIASLLASLAFLTKSFHVAPLALTLLIFFMLDIGIAARSLKYAAGCFCTALLPISIWGWFRYQADGIVFFEKMIGYDLIKRSSQTIEGHQSDLFFYFQNTLIEFRYWILLAAALLLITAYHARRKGRLMSLLPGCTASLFFLKLSIAAAVPMFLFTTAASKLPWYTYPAYPFLGMLLGSLLARCLVAIKEQGTVRATRIATLFLFVVLCIAEANILRRIVKSSVDNDKIQQQLIELGSNAERKWTCIILVNTGWSQSRILAAQLYGDFIPIMDNEFKECKRIVHLSAHN